MSRPWCKSSRPSAVHPDREGLKGGAGGHRREGVRRDLLRHCAWTRRPSSAVGFEEGHTEMVILRDILSTPCASTTSCPSMASSMRYIDNGRVVGISKIGARRGGSTRAQLQERMTTRLAETSNSALTLKASCGTVRAEHLCMTMRGSSRAPTSRPPRARLSGERGYPR